MRTAVYGSRPDVHARVLIELFGLDPVGLLDDYAENRDRTIQGARVIGGLEDLERLGLDAVVLGFGAARGRQAIVETARAAGMQLPTLVHERAHVAASAVLGDGCQVLPLAYVGPGVTLEAGVLVNTGAVVEHDCRIGMGAVIDPGAVLASRVHVGSEAEIGSGAVVIPDMTIGDRAMVGAGAVVIRNVDAGVTVVGVPAAPLGNTKAHHDQNP